MTPMLATRRRRPPAGPAPAACPARPGAGPCRPARGRRPPRARTAPGLGGRRRPARRGRRARTTAGGGAPRGWRRLRAAPAVASTRMASSSLPGSARSSARTSRALHQDVGGGRGGAQLVPQGFHAAVVTHGRWQSMRTGSWLGSPPDSTRAACEVPDRLAPAARAVTHESVQLACRRGLGYLVGEGSGDAHGLGIAVALVGASRGRQAIGHLSGLGAAARPRRRAPRRRRWGGPRRLSATSAKGAGRRCRSVRHRQGRGVWRLPARPGTPGAGRVGRFCRVCGHAVEDPDLFRPRRAGAPAPGALRLALAVGAVGRVLAEQPGTLAGHAPPSASGPGQAGCGGLHASPAAAGATRTRLTRGVGRSRFAAGRRAALSVAGRGPGRGPDARRRWPVGGTRRLPVRWASPWPVRRVRPGTRRPRPTVPADRSGAGRRARPATPVTILEARTGGAPRRPFGRVVDAASVPEGRRRGGSGHRTSARFALGPRPSPTCTFLLGAPITARRNAPPGAIGPPDAPTPTSTFPAAAPALGVGSPGRPELRLGVPLVSGAPAPDTIGGRAPAARTVRSAGTPRSCVPGHTTSVPTSVSALRMSPTATADVNVPGPSRCSDAGKPKAQGT